MTIQTINNGDTGLTARTKINSNTSDLDSRVTAAASVTTTISLKSANYTLIAADSSTIVQSESASALVITLPNNLPVGFQVAVIQNGAGQVTFTPASGAQLVSRQSYTKTAGQNAIVSLIVNKNADGSTARYLLTGDGA